jgi:hypothetical protein
MKRKIVFEIECGDLTCASEPGEFCKFLGVSHFGTKFCCCLFSEDSSYTDLREKNGWIMRCKECMNYESL